MVLVQRLSEPMEFSLLDIKSLAFALSPVPITVSSSFGLRKAGQLAIGPLAAN